MLLECEHKNYKVKIWREFQITQDKFLYTAFFTNKDNYLERWRIELDVPFEEVVSGMPDFHEKEVLEAFDNDHHSLISIPVPPEYEI